MKVVFFKDVEGTAQVGDIKEVKLGFARNYLLPRGLAAPTTKDNVQHALALAEREKRTQAKLDAEARVVAGPLGGSTVSIEARVGETGRLFGSVTNRDIAEALKRARGVDVDAHAVLLPEPIRELGARSVTVRFTRNVTAEVTVDVVPDAESKGVVERLAAQAEAERIEAEKKAAEAAYTAEHEGGRGRRRGGAAQPEETTAE